MATPKYFIWEYRTLVEVGAGCRTFAPERFTEMGCKRVGMITDHGLVEAGVANMVSDIFKIQGGLQLIDVYDRIQPDATMNVINDCARWYRENALDGMLVVGGGSVMDSAKGVKYLLGTGGTCIQEPLADNVLFHFRPNARPLNVPSIFIPTTAGTGSEVSTVAVIYNEETKLKTNFKPNKVIGADPAIRSCAVGTRRIMTRIASGADITIEPLDFPSGVGCAGIIDLSTSMTKEVFDNDIRSTVTR
jgi:alcohol dehydrogenase class IV